MTPRNYPSDKDNVHWVARHVPLSVSVASNVPSHEQVQCLVTDGDPDTLVADVMDNLRAMSGDAYEVVLEDLAEAKTDAARSPEDGAKDTKSRPTTNPSKKADVTSVRRAPSITLHRVQFGQVRSERHQTVTDTPLPRRSKDRGRC